MEAVDKMEIESNNILMSLDVINMFENITKEETLLALLRGHSDG